jgi:hypothetical protein
MQRPAQRVNYYLIAFLATVYFSVVYAFTANFPIDDDFALLALLNRHVDGYPVGLEQLLASHNEHRIALTRIVFLSTYELFGFVNFRFLAVVGNLCIFGLFLLCCLRLPGKVGFGSIGLVIAAMLFQYGSAESMFWATAAISNYLVLLFVVWGMVVLQKPGLQNLGLAILLAVLAVVTQGNGLLLPFIMAFYLLLERRYVSCITLCVAAVGVAIAYLSPLNLHSSGDSLGKWFGMLPAKLLFALSFLGNAFGIGGSNFPLISGLSIMVTVSIGLLIVGLTAYALCFHRKQNVNLLVSLNMFFILTALMVAESRVHYGLAQSLVSRYHINSAVLIVSSILLCRELFPTHWFWERMEQSFWTIALSLAYVLGTGVFVMFFYLNIFAPAHRGEIISGNPQLAAQQLQKSIELGIFEPSE